MTSRAIVVAILPLLAGMNSGLAQQPTAKPKPGDLMMDRYLADQVRILSQRFLDGAKTLEEWQARRPRLKQEYLDMLGLWPMPERTPLHVSVTGTLAHDAVTIEKLHFQSRPGLYVTGNLYRPRHAQGKLPAVLYVCGHSSRGRDGNKTAFQDHGMWFATNGYICLIIDTLQLGEIPGVHHGTYREGRWWWQALGYTPAGVECWNGIRAIDYLLGRSDVDAERIAVTGISGGGASTVWIAAADERVKCAVPVSGMSDLESYVTNKVINGHCDCMFLVNTYRWEWTTIAALIAPRPMLFCNSDNDTIFPMDGNRRIIARLRQIYQMYGKADLVDDYVSHGGHAYRPDLRIASFKWINKHVKNETGQVTDADFKPIPGNDLRVFAEDEELPRDSLNARIDQSFVGRAKGQPPQAATFQEWRASLFKRVQDQSFREWSTHIPQLTIKQSLNWEVALDAGADTSLETEAGVSLPITTIREYAEKNHSTRLILIYVLNPGERAGTLPRWAEPFAKGSTVVFVPPRGVGATAWTRNSPPNYVERAAALIGHTADRGRVFDIATTARFLRSFVKRMVPNKKLPVYHEDLSIRIVGKGASAVLAAYAGILEQAIDQVVAVDPPTSHEEGPCFLNILRILDVPEALGLLAPKRLWLIDAGNKTFDRTAEIYRLAGAGDKLERK